MIITYHGLQFFKFQFGNLVIAVNPISKSSKTQEAGKIARFGADIALVSLNHHDFNGVENLSHGDRHPFLIYGPGEYEVKDVVVRGYLIKTIYEKKESWNTIYSLILDGLHLCFLGSLNSPTIPEEIFERIGNVDILFVPTGRGLLSPNDAHKISLPFSPAIIIPMHYDSPAELKKFLEEAGAEGVKPTEKLTIKKKDAEGKDGDVVVLKLS